MVDRSTTRRRRRRSLPPSPPKDRRALTFARPLQGLPAKPRRGPPSRLGNATFCSRGRRPLISSVGESATRGGGGATAGAL